MKSKKGPFKMKKPSALKFFGIRTKPKHQTQLQKHMSKGLQGYGSGERTQKRNVKTKGLGNRILRALGF